MSVAVHAKRLQQGDYRTSFSIFRCTLVLPDALFSSCSDFVAFPLTLNVPLCRSLLLLGVRMKSGPGRYRLPPASVSDSHLPNGWHFVNLTCFAECFWYQVWSAPCLVKLVNLTKKITVLFNYYFYLFVFCAVSHSAVCSHSKQGICSSC